MTYLIGLVSDFIKKNYKKDISYNIKKYMDVNKFIFNYECNVARCKRDFSIYTLIILFLYIIGSILIFARFINPVIKGYPEYLFLIITIFVLFLLIMFMINNNLIRFFLGDIGEAKNVNLSHKQKRILYREIMFILAGYDFSYVLLLIFIITININILFLAILVMILVILPINSKLERNFKKIEGETKKYYKDTIKIKTEDVTKEYKPSETLIQILSNNDLIIIENGAKFAQLLQSKIIKYIRIENDLYYIKEGKYILKEDFFKNKAKIKLKRSHVRKRKNLI